jgi:hypothetical protein
MYVYEKNGAVMMSPTPLKGEDWIGYTLTKKPGIFLHIIEVYYKGTWDKIGTFFVMGDYKSHQEATQFAKTCSERAGAVCQVSCNRKLEVLTWDDPPMRSFEEWIEYA